MAPTLWDAAMESGTMRHQILMICGLFACADLAAQEKEGAKGALPIQDNSFLLEEAYNQEDGVVQHINTFTRFRQSKDWVYTFTEEVPVPTQKHQLSVTVPFQRLETSLDGRRAFGDVALNYRYQALGDGESTVAFSPRFSLLLPTGDEKQLRGNGALGYQVNLPLSVMLSKQFVTHINLGTTFTPGAKSPLGEKADLSAWNFGQSFIWLARPTFNAMLEFAYNSGEQVAGPGLKERVNTFFVNPGFRWAINCKNGLQIVPGISVPVGVGPSKGERAIFLYLSFEHLLWKVK